MSFFSLSQHGEKQLQSIDMGLAVERIRQQYLAGEYIGRIDRFFYGAKYSTQFPDWLRTLPAGFHKIQRDHLVWHVMVVDYPDQRYMLLRDYTMFENARLHPMGLSLFVLLSSLLLSLILVWITLHFVIYPIEKIEKDIREKLSPQHAKQLTDSYAEHEIGQLAQAFDEVYDKLNQALQREKLFTADVSHELRTPLMVILSSCELVLAKPTLPLQAQQHLQHIQLSAHQILQRLQVYLALARQSSTLQAQFEQRSFLTIAHAVLTENKNLADRYQVKLALQQQGPDRDYPADFCHTILSNLIRNAIEYAGMQCTVTILLQQNGFSVIDDGIGISAQHHPQIFAAFTRLTTHSSQHLGLGLSLVQRICQYLNWQIQFVSQPNQGARFTILTQSVETHT